MFLIIMLQGNSSWSSFADGKARCNHWNKHLWCICPCQSQHTDPHCGWCAASQCTGSITFAKNNQKDFIKVADVIDCS